MGCAHALCKKLMAKARRNAPRAKKAGLKFPVGRIHRRLTAHTTGHVHALAAIYTAAVLEYLAREVLVQAGTAAKSVNGKQIVPSDIRLAVHRNRDLHALIKTIVDSGVTPSAQSKRTAKD